jgi:hypothetical protein
VSNISISLLLCIVYIAGIYVSLSSLDFLCLDLPLLVSTCLYPLLEVPQPLFIRIVQNGGSLPTRIIVPHPV